MQKTRVRIHFTKAGDLRWISHRDLARTWERLLRRAGLELAFSEGFHPKPRISFPSALALGIEALDEIVEMVLLGDVDSPQARQNIELQMPEGMRLLSMEALPPGASKAQMVAASYDVELKQADMHIAQQRLDSLKAVGQIELDRDGKKMSARFGDEHFDIQCEGNVLRFTLPATAQGSLRPVELLAALQIAHVLPEGALLRRTHVHLANASIDNTAIANTAAGSDQEAESESADALADSES